MPHRLLYSKTKVNLFNDYSKTPISSLRTVANQASLNKRQPCVAKTAATYCVVPSSKHPFEPPGSKNSDDSPKSKEYWLDPTRQTRDLPPIELSLSHLYKTWPESRNRWTKRGAVVNLLLSELESDNLNCPEPKVGTSDSQPRVLVCSCVYSCWRKVWAKPS